MIALNYIRETGLLVCSETLVALSSRRIVFQPLQVYENRCSPSESSICSSVKTRRRRATPLDLCNIPNLLRHTLPGPLVPTPARSLMPQTSRDIRLQHNSTTSTILEPERAQPGLRHPQLPAPARHGRLTNQVPHSTASPCRTDPPHEDPGVSCPKPSLQLQRCYSR